jgi:hypothetical protein
MFTYVINMKGKAYPPQSINNSKNQTPSKSRQKAKSIKSQEIRKSLLVSDEEGDRKSCSAEEAGREQSY